MAQSNANMDSMSFEYNSTSSDGIEYQRLLAIHLLLQASIKNCDDFKLAFEMKASKAFDDVVFYQKDIWYLIQAKHAKRSRKLTYHMLFKARSTNYRLSKYLESYCNIRENPQFGGQTNCVILTTSEMNDSLKNICKKKKLDILFDITNSKTHYQLEEKSIEKEIHQLVEDTNTQFYKLRDAVMTLFQEGIATKEFMNYRTPLMEIIEKSSENQLKLCPPKDSRKRTKQLFVFLQKMKNHTVKLDKKIFKQIFAGLSRYKSLPPFTDEKQARQFVKDLFLLVTQPKSEEFLKIIHTNINTWMRELIPPDDFAMLTSDQLQIPAKQLKVFLKKWEDSTESEQTAKGPQRRERKFLTLNDTHKWMRDIEDELLVWIRQNHRKSCLSLNDMETCYIKRRISIGIRNFIDNEIIDQLYTTFDSQNCFVLIASPGMGKSILWQYMAFRAQKKYSECLVCLIYANNICEKTNEIHEVDDVLGIFKPYLSPENYENLKNKQKDIILFLDAFDELSSENAESLLRAVQILMNNSDNVKVFLSSRKRMQQKLEGELHVTAMSVKPLSYKQQIAFLEFVWKSKKDSLQFLKSFYMRFDDQQCSIFGTPIFLRIFAYEFKPIQLENQRVKIINQPSIVDLYNKFVSKCLDETYNKVNNVPIDKQIPNKCKLVLESWERDHQLIAFDEQIPEELKKLMYTKHSSTNVKCIRERIVKNSEESLLLQVLDNSSKFVHESMSEFLAAKYLYQYIGEYFFHETEPFKIKIIQKLDQHKTFRMFLFEMINSKLNGRHLDFLKMIGEQAAFWACQEDCYKLIVHFHQMYDYKAILYGELRESMLHVAVRSNAIRTLKFLLMNGCDVKTIDSNFDTILHIAVEYSTEDIVEYLINQGCDVNSPNFLGNTPVHVAVKRKDLNILKLLTSKGARVDLKGQNGNTALHLAVENQSKEMVDHITEQNIDINSINREGKTAIQIAFDSSQRSMHKLLVSKEAVSENVMGFDTDIDYFKRLLPK